jgi:hypothetical protein
MTSFTTETGELVRIGVDKLAAKLPEEERLRLAKALIVAAYEIAPEDRAEISQRRSRPSEPSR